MRWTVRCWMGELRADRMAWRKPFLSKLAAVHGGAAFESYFTATNAADHNSIENSLIHNIPAPAGNVFENGGVLIEGHATNTKVWNNVFHDITDMGARAGA